MDWALPPRHLAELPPLVLEVFVSPPVPANVSIRGSSSYELRFASRVSTRQCPPPVVSDWAVPSMRFLASSRHQLTGFAVADGFHTTAAVRPQVFATSRRFAPRPALRACFIPLARPGFSLQGLLLTGSRHGSSPRSCPLAVTTRQAPLRATNAQTDFRALLSRRARCVRSAVKRAKRPIPSWASSLSRASFTPAADRVPTILPSRACLASVRDGGSGAPQGLDDQKIGRLSRDLQPS
jgi:hypothetical protein